jgi:thymidine kinase
MHLNALRVPRIAEKALVFLFAEQNLLTEEQVRGLTDRLGLDTGYLSTRLADNQRPIRF